MILYTVLANRFGDDHNHSYLVGVFDDKTKAAAAAIAEEYWRSGKYDCTILTSELNQGFSRCGDKLKEVQKWCEEHCLPNGEYSNEISKRILESNI